MISSGLQFNNNSGTTSIAVVVPSYNQAAFLEETLRSLFYQRHPRLAVYVVDGGSTDGSAELIRRYQSHLTYWVSEPDRGQSDALNKGFAHTSEDWLGWLNSDDLLLPGALQALEDAIIRHPEESWFAGAGWFIDALGQRIRPYRAPAQTCWAQDFVPWTDKWFAQPGCFFSRKLYQTAGGFLREDLHYAMDLDLWLRMGQHAPMRPLEFEMGAYRLHDKSKTISQRPAMEREVVQVLLENLGLEAALERVEYLAQQHADCDFRLQRLVNELCSPRGWLSLGRRRLCHYFDMWWSVDK